MRVLAVCPIPRLRSDKLWFPRAMDTILGQDFDGQIDYLMEVGDSTVGDRYDRITMKYEHARHIALEQHYDLMWCVEYDMIVPRDALNKLIALNADIAYGLYCWRWEPFYWSAYTYLDYLTGISLSQQRKQAVDSWGKVIDVKGVGQGCAVIKRSALEQFTFRRAGNACADWYMAWDAQNLGLTQKTDLSVVCGHMGITPRPFVVWPDPKTASLCRLEYFDA